MDQHRWKRVCGLLACVFACAGEAMAGTVVKPDVDAKSGIDMEVESWLEKCPQAGLMPMTWRVSNGSGEMRTWELQFSSGLGYGRTQARVSRFAMTVAAGQRSEMVLFVPVALVGPGYYGARDVLWTVTGMGVSGGGSVDSVNGSSLQTDFIGLSEGVAGTGGWNSLEKELKGLSLSKSLRGSEVVMDKAPEDWRGYSGLAQLWVTDGEWLKMSELARAAVLDWVGFGGRLFVMVEDEGGERVEALGLPVLVGDVRPAGAGVVRMVRWDGRVMPVKDVVKWVQVEHASLRDTLEDYDDDWSLVKLMGRLVLNAPLVFGFIVVFGLLVGPVNLFWFAGAGRRSRLFWTTPLLSVVGSLLLMGLMVVQDGFGGAGKRLVLVMLQPEGKRMGVVQEQVSKTGVLLAGAFEKGELMMLNPLNVEDRGVYSNVKEVFNESNQGVSGAWFSSRSIQGQLMQAVRPTRAVVEFFAGSGEGAAPEVLSSVGVTLNEVYVVDEAGNAWKVAKLGTGERKRMERAGVDEVKGWMKRVMLKQAGPTLKAMLEGVMGRNGFVYAVSDEVGDLAMGSLDSIRWEGDRLMVIGPYLKSEE